jgi:DNA-binding MarR family transcriptional regulator
MTENAEQVALTDEVAELAPITALLSSRLMVLANLLKRGAIIRYKRLAGLSSVGMDKGQISRALAGLVSRKLVVRSGNPRDNREVLVCLTRAGLAAHDAIVAGAQERTQRLLEGLSEDDVTMLLDHIDRLTVKAEAMLAAEREPG